ncbi:RNA pyrophosphohydrolase [Methylobacterium sp. E-025]|jgi:putative (di)nucleoside polyphosphate hydrolase|uniref:RNA pyrophosphohydrolase n=1 Tax=unclassified Methylobacterium TaxID=2615210 RepID=UPI001FBB9C20|nr:MULTISPECIES: RNA pyrophosphohydrolase [unclassified Methylobacterium]MCJ2008970.1 RNA pyrophosphohydrolase [Methylobacterium sp. J-092]MCJ2077461.1 RNA pyrophosphohydrolase [Methylobacterium sp. E-016]MCJ2113959.1 RNA pyrophosphohydrolase [Methylobacterium sp. E-025]
MKSDTESRDPGESLPYRPCVGVTLINRAGLVFVGRRKPEAGPEHVAGDLAWQMPQGGIDDGEAPQAAALRELHEETNVGAASVRLLAEAPDWLSYDLPPDVRKQAWRGRYRGQTQRWFAFGFLGDDDAIDVERPGGGAHKAEFDAWRWVPFAELPGLIVPFKRPVYEGVVAAFAPLHAWSVGA